MASACAMAKGGERGTNEEAVSDARRNSSPTFKPEAGKSSGRFKSKEMLRTCYQEPLTSEQHPFSHIQ